MLWDSQGWTGALMRACPTARDAGWWVRLSVRDAAAEAIAFEAKRIAADVCRTQPQLDGALRRLLGAPATKERGPVRGDGWGS